MMIWLILFLPASATGLGTTRGAVAELAALDELEALRERCVEVLDVLWERRIVGVHASPAADGRVLLRARARDLLALDHVLQLWLECVSGLAWAAESEAS